MSEWASRIFPIRGKFDFAHLPTIVFDQILRRISHYCQQKTAARLMAEAKLEDARLTWPDVLAGHRYTLGAEQAVTERNLSALPTSCCRSRGPRSSRHQPSL